MTKHKRVIFNGEGYSDEWVKEAEKRGLPNLKTTVEATDVLLDDKVKELFVESKVLTATELKSRAMIKYQAYSNLALIDAKTMSHMAHKLYIPSVNKFAAFLASEISSFKAATIDAPASTIELLSNVTKLLDSASAALNTLDNLILEAKNFTGRDLAVYCEKKLLPAMRDLREPIDSLELIVAKEYWPVPSYGDLLFHIL